MSNIWFILRRNSGFTVGDKVRVLYKPNKQQFDWYNGFLWYHAMNNFIGEVSTIENMGEHGSILIRLEGELSWWFPTFILEKVEDA